MRRDLSQALALSSENRVFSFHVLMAEEHDPPSHDPRDPA
jgi:hypothetical protein